MAQKRMLDKKISVSEQVANLAIEAQLIFTWAVPHADDLGLLPSSPRTLKAMVVPMMEISLEDFGFHVESIVSAGLWEMFTHSKETYYRIPKFCEYQTLKKDRKPSTYLFDVTSWERAEELGFHLEDIGTLREEKGREGKRREEKADKPHAHLDYLINIPPEDLKEMNEKFEASTSQIKRKGEQFRNYCLSKAKTYRNYRAALENALDKDFGRREVVQKKVEEVELPLTPAQKKRIEETKSQINEIAKGKRVEA